MRSEPTTPTDVAAFLVSLAQWIDVRLTGVLARFDEEMQRVRASDAFQASLADQVSTLEQRQLELAELLDTEGLRRLHQLLEQQLIGLNQHISDRFETFDKERDACLVDLRRRLDILDNPPKKRRLFDIARRAKAKT